MEVAHYRISVAALSLRYQYCLSFVAVMCWLPSDDPTVVTGAAFHVEQ